MTICLKCVSAIFKDVIPMTEFKKVRFQKNRSTCTVLMGIKGSGRERYRSDCFVAEQFGAC